MIKVMLAILTCALSIGATSASAGRYLRRPAQFLVEPAGEAVGCYWYRQREFCSRYCYYEVNGKRYCHHNQREAHPQALIVDDYLYAPAMK